MYMHICNLCTNTSKYNVESQIPAVCEVCIYVYTQRT